MQLNFHCYAHQLSFTRLLATHAGNQQGQVQVLLNLFLQLIQQQ
jgi:hypothetical protein